MIIQDKSTTVSCSVCSEEYTVDGFLYTEKVMRRKVSKLGWTVVDDQDFCPSCSAKRVKSKILVDGHFTASQLLAFRAAAEKANKDNQLVFACPICSGMASFDSRFTSANCSVCDVQYRKER